MVYFLKWSLRCDGNLWPQTAIDMHSGVRVQALYVAVAVADGMRVTHQGWPSPLDEKVVRFD